MLNEISEPEKARDTFGFLSLDEQDAVINQQIQLAEDNQSNLCVGMLVGIIVGVAIVCFCLTFVDNGAQYGKALGGLGVFAGMWLGQQYDKIRKKTLAKCPQCGYDWEIRLPQMNTLKCEKCPGCGIRMAAARHFG